MGVRNEIEIALNSGRAIECRSILDFQWLGDPIECITSDLLSVARLQAALGNAGLENEANEESARHLGEAEGIHLAKRLGYFFVTDDNDAYRIARHRLSEWQVLDTVEVLRVIVANGDLTKPRSTA
jgi:predicted nucleic acid-binding protein